LFPLWKQSGADPAGLVLRDGAAYSIYSEYLEPAPFYLGLRAWVRDASRLLSGLTALPFHFEIAEARIFAGETAPLVLIGLRTYLRDENWDGRVDTAGIGFERFIDVNSPLLLVPVEPLPNNKPDERRSLPDWKRILFRK
jgi:hypothetical protein